MPSLNVPENDRLGCDDKMVEFHTQAGLVDKSWILLDSGACANCCAEWLAPDYPVLPLSGVCLERHWMCKVERLCSLTVAMATR